MADETKSPEEPVARTEASTGEIVGKPADTTGGKPTLTAKVYAPFEVFFEGPAFSVTALNESGPFDILPGHQNFICMLLPCDVIVRAPADEKVIKVSRALLHVNSNKVTIYVDV